MKTLRKVTIEPVFLTDTLPEYKDMEENKIYISEKYNSCSHKCLCGCGMETYMMFNRDGSTKHWDLVKENNGTISIIGSVGNYNFPCKSHYIITKNVANFC